MAAVSRLRLNFSANTATEGDLCPVHGQEKTVGGRLGEWRGQPWSRACLFVCQMPACTATLIATPGHSCQ